MKGLSTKAKVGATVFLLVCLAANNQSFENNNKEVMGSSTLASSSSLRIEQSSVLPSKAVEDCKLVEGSSKDEQYHVDEKGIVDSEYLRKKIDEEIDDSDLSARERREAAHKRRSSSPSNSNNKITFKVNYKLYTCKYKDGSTATEKEYAIDSIETTEGSIECPGGCNMATTQAKDFSDIAEKIITTNLKDEINLTYELAQLKKINQEKANNCEGELEVFSDGSSEFFEYGDNAEDDKLHRECLAKNIRKKRRNRTKSLEIYKDLEKQLTSLAQSKNKEDREEAIELIDSLHGRTGRGLHEDIIASLRNIKQFANGSISVDKTANDFDEKIQQLIANTCGPKPEATCLNNPILQGQIGILSTQKNQILASEKNVALNPQVWSITNSDGGQESYREWHARLGDYFDKTMQQIQNTYTGPADTSNKVTERKTSLEGLNNRIDFFTGNGPSSNTSVLGKDIGNVPSIFTQSN